MSKQNLVGSLGAILAISLLAAPLPALAYPCMAKANFIAHALDRPGQPPDGILDVNIGDELECSDDTREDVIRSNLMTITDSRTGYLYYIEKKYVDPPNPPTYKPTLHANIVDSWLTAMLIAILAQACLAAWFWRGSMSRFPRFAGAPTAPNPALMQAMFSGFQWQHNIVADQAGALWRVDANDKRVMIEPYPKKIRLWYRWSFDADSGEFYKVARKSIGDTTIVNTAPYSMRVANPYIDPIFNAAWPIVLLLVLFSIGFCSTFSGFLFQNMYGQTVPNIIQGWMLSQLVAAGLNWVIVKMVWQIYVRVRHPLQMLVGPQPLPHGAATGFGPPVHGDGPATPEAPAVNLLYRPNQ